jgi:AcrR family transcriptional regulator
MTDNTTSKSRQLVKTVASASLWSGVLDEHRAYQRKHILGAALELLRERGMAGLTMSALSKRAGISRATLYHYFADIDAVLAAWVGAEIEHSMSTMVSEARAISDPLDRLAHLVEAQARTFAGQDHRLSAEHFESEAGSPAIRREVGAQMAPMRQLLADTVAEARAQGTLRSQIDAVLAADLVLGILGAIRRRLVAGTLCPEEATQAVMELIRSGWLSPGAGDDPDGGS